MTLTVFGSDLSPYTRMVVSVCEYLHLEYRYELTPPYGKNPAFQEASLFGKIPAVADENLKISDSTAIMTYIDDVYNKSGSKIYGDEPVTRAHIRFWEKYVHVDTGALTQLWSARCYVPMFLKRPVNEKLVAAAIEESRAVFETLERQIAGDYLVGDRYTAADFALFGKLSAWELAKGTIDESAYPKLSKYYSSMRARPEFAKSLNGAHRMLARMKL